VVGPSVVEIVSVRCPVIFVGSMYDELTHLLCNYIVIAWYYLDRWGEGVCWPAGWNMVIDQLPS